MLLRRRLTGLDSIPGLLFEGQPPAGGAPAGDAGSGAPPTGTPPAGGSAGTGTPPAPAPGTPPTEDRSGWIPRQRFDEVNSRLQALEAAEAKKQEDEAKKRGDFEKIDAAQKQKIADAEARAVRIARRAAFIAKASGKVADPEAAFKLALADGDLEALDVDDDGNAKDPKAVEKIIDELTKRYEFLKADGKRRDFGQPAGGNGGGQPLDTSKMGARDMLQAGYAERGVGTPGSGFRSR